MRGMLRTPGTNASSIGKVTAALNASTPRMLHTTKNAAHSTKRISGTSRKESSRANHRILRQSAVLTKRQIGPRATGTGFAITEGHEPLRIVRSSAHG